MKILCIGAGAIGLLAGGSASAQGADVTFLVKRGQESNLADKEIFIHNQDRITRAKKFDVVNDLVVSDAASIFDVVFIAVKAFDTEQVISQLGKSRVVFRAILCLQNGVENEDKFRDAFPQAEVIGASVVSAVSRLDDTAIRVEKNRGIGLSGNSAYTQQICDIFTQAGLRPKVYPDLAAMKWSKMLSNLFSNATSGILDMAPPEVYKRKGLFRIEKAQILETVAVMRKLNLRVTNLPGLPLRALVFLIKFVPDGLLQPLLTKLVAGGRGDKMPSFYIEKMKGSNRSEVNYLNGAVVRSGEAAGVPTPVNHGLTDIFNQILADKKIQSVYSRHPEKLETTIGLV